ncbi:MAG: glycosyltransferase family 9 protein [Thermoanaerobaculia bacterium]|nr:glycosyltransferase family 9 protein [Thermoanaerobaculia bacterium]
MDLSSILLVRTSALGDVVHARPVFNAVRHALPEARIGWIVEAPFAPLIADLEGIEVLPVRLRSWRRSWTSSATRHEAFEAFRRIRRFDASAAIDLMGNHKGAFLARLSGAPVRIGSEQRQRRETMSHLLINREVPIGGEHAVDRGLSLLQALDLTPEEADFTGDRLLPAATPSSSPIAGDDSPYVLIQPGAGWGNKRYPPDRWGQVAQQLAADGYRVFVLGGPGEEALAEQVVQSSREQAQVAVGPGMEFLVAALRGARLVLGGDTGPLHLAHALGTPVVAVMGPTDPKRHGPYQAPQTVVINRLPCSFCSRRMNSTQACLHTIPPAWIVDAARRELGSTPSASSNSVTI